MEVGIMLKTFFLSAFINANTDFLLINPIIQSIP